MLLWPIQWAVSLEFAGRERFDNKLSAKENINFSAMS
jgi:hypothetical protein